MSSILSCLLPFLQLLEQDHQCRPYQQTQSPFFIKFPAEIRMLIYKYAVPGGARKPGVCIVRHLQVRERKGKEDTGTYSHWKDPYFQSVLGRRGSRCETVGLHGAVLVCKRMYIEAIAILYSEPAFSLQAYGHLIAFTTLTPRPNLAHIKSLTLNLNVARYDFGPYHIHASDPHFHSHSHSPKKNVVSHPTQKPDSSLNEALASMIRLRELTITIKCSQSWPSRSWEMEVFAPVWKVRNTLLRRFEVVIDWRPFTVEVDGEYESEGGIRWRVVSFTERMGRD